MAVQSIGLETLAEALLQQGFYAADELGFSLIYQRANDSLKVHLGLDGSFTALDGNDEVIAEGTGTEDLYAILVTKTLISGRQGAPILRRSRPPIADQFDWHIDQISRATPVTTSYRCTQNVRRFLLTQCGAKFQFDRAFMRWIKDGVQKTMGDVADEWVRRNSK